MKKKLLFALVALLTTLSIQAFTAKTIEGVEMTFKVISEEDKTCQVGEGSSSAIVSSTAGYLTFPVIAKGYKVTSITIPKGVASIGNSAFWGCGSLTIITIPETVTNIGWGAFSHCFSLTSITIPESLTSIGSSAFKYCKGLTSITIPKSVMSIGSEAFYECNGLTKVISKIAEPFTVDNKFLWSYYGTTLYVPKGTVEKYKATNGWKEFKIIAEIGTEVAASGDVNGDGKVDVTSITDIVLNSK